MKKSILLLLVGLFVVGCGQFPDPNDITSVELSQRAATADRLLDAFEATLDYKVQTAEITDQERLDYISKYADELLKSVDPNAVPPDSQWQYATLLRVTNRWPEAQKALELAVKAAITTDRKVNDSLKLAQAMAINGDVPGAIKMAESVMNVDDRDAAPILPSVLNEIVKAGQGKGHDKELADLLKKAIACHERVVVDKNTDEGKGFMIARRDWIRRANLKLSELIIAGH